MKIINEMNLSIKAISCNEGFARSCVAAFCLPANPSIDEITDIKTAVSEAVTNSVVHAYPQKDGVIDINVKLYNSFVEIRICDNGVGIDDFEKAKQPFFTTKPNEERSGMGFCVMESFMDSLEVCKNKNKGVAIFMTKNFKSGAQVAKHA